MRSILLVLAGVGVGSLAAMVLLSSGSLKNQAMLVGDAYRDGPMPSPAAPSGSFGEGGGEERKALSGLMGAKKPREKAARGNLEELFAQDTAVLGAGGIGASGYGAGGGGVGLGMVGKRGVMKTVEVTNNLSSAPRVRAWFPETFLFDPLVVTDAEGRASVDVTVPDRLTTWRVLALAHARDGAQAGTTASFLGTLPTYVDPVVPSFLRVGDEVRLPVQIVNTTTTDANASLQVEAVSASWTGASSTVRIAGGSSRVEYGTLKATQAGTATVRATLGDRDAVAREIQVRPVGRPIAVRRTGTLGAPRTLSLELPANVDPATVRARLVVHPGASSLLHGELGTVLHRGGPAEDAYALLLAGRASELLRSLGETPDAEAMRTLSMIATQRVVRHARNPDAAQAALLAEAAFAHPGNPVLERLGERLSAMVAEAQRPDGTCSGATGWTVQRLLVATTECIAAVQAGAQASELAAQRATLTTLRASGAFERLASHVQDGYTAAAILASGAVRGPVAEKLREVLRGAAQKAEDGTWTLPVDGNVVRADGLSPSTVEAAALAVLALGDDDKALRADLGAIVLSNYASMRGWGDGRANRHALRAALALLKDAPVRDVKLTFALDDKAFGDGSITAKDARDPFVFQGLVPGAQGAHRWTITADPPMPGLSFALDVEAYVPWSAGDAPRGIELTVSTPAKASVGAALPVTLEAAAPAGVALTVRQELPAGVQPDRPSLDALVSSEAISSFDVQDGAIVFEVPPLVPGKLLRLTWKAVPTLAGTLQSGATSIRAQNATAVASWAPPTTWKVTP